MYVSVQNLENGYRSHLIMSTCMEQGNVQFSKILMMVFHIWNHILMGFLYHLIIVVVVAVVVVVVVAAVVVRVVKGSIMDCSPDT